LQAGDPRSECTATLRLKLERVVMCPRINLGNKFSFYTASSPRAFGTPLVECNGPIWDRDTKHRSDGAVDKLDLSAMRLD